MEKRRDGEADPEYRAAIERRPLARHLQGDSQDRERQPLLVRPAAAYDDRQAERRPEQDQKKDAPERQRVGPGAQDLGPKRVGVALVEALQDGRIARADYGRQQPPETLPIVRV